MLNLFARPVIPIAIAIATVDNGEIIIKLKTIEISIHINTGCNSVKLLTILPMPVVIICTYGNISTPIVADKPPTIVGYTISAMLPTRFSINKINNTAIVAVIIVLIKSPMPAITQAPFLNCATRFLHKMHKQQLQSLMVSYQISKQ